MGVRAACPPSPTYPPPPPFPWGGCQVFVPESRPAPHEGFELAQLFPMRVAKLAITLTLGWPLYLLLNVASRPYPGHRWVSHFDPMSPIFRRVVVWVCM